MARKLIQVRHESFVVIGKSVSLDGRRAQSERGLSVLGIGLELDVLFINSGQDQRHARDTSGNISLSCAEVSKGSLLRNAEDGQILLAERQVGHLDHIKDSVAAVTHKHRSDSLVKTPAGSKIASTYYSLRRR